MANALLITPDGGISQVPMPIGESDSVNATIEGLDRRVRLTTRLDMWVDHQGALTREVNLLATALARHFGYLRQPYYGPVLITHFNLDDGTTHGLEPFQVHALLIRLTDVVSAS